MLQDIFAPDSDGHLTQFWSQVAAGAVCTLSDGSGAAANKPIDGTEFVAGRAVLLLLSDGGEVCDVVGCGHGDGPHPEATEGSVVIEQRAVLGVGVEQVERVRASGEAAFDVLEEAAQDGPFKGMEEKGDGGCLGQRVQRGVGEVQGERSQRVGLDIMPPEFNIGMSDGNERWVKLDAFHAQERNLRGQQHGAALAGADVEKDGLLDGLRRSLIDPDIEQAAQDTWSDAIVGG